MSQAAHPSLSTELALAELAQILGEERCLQGKDELDWYGKDRTHGTWPVSPLAIALPNTVEELQSVLQIAARAGWGIVPSGGRTGLVAGAYATNGELVISLERMRRITRVDERALLLECEAGATLEEVQLAAQQKGLIYPVDFAAKGSAQIGGTIATNAGGVRVLRYGSTRAWVRGLEVVLVDGRRLDLTGELIKDNTGYALGELFVGSEGTLGLITGVTLGLCAPPVATVVALCALPSMGAVVDWFAALRNSGLALCAFECFDHGCVQAVVAHRGGEAGGPFAEPASMYALFEIELAEDSDQARERVQEILVEMMEAALENETLLDLQVALNPAQGARMWDWRESISESLHPLGPHKSDVSLPLGELAAFCAAYEHLLRDQEAPARLRVFGHIGDGNLHLNLIAAEGTGREQFQQWAAAFDEEAYALVAHHGGSISAEHGVGLLKRDHLHHRRSPLELELMRSIKAVFDPQGRMNPGKLLPPA